jgi:type II secretion system protein G
MNTKKMFKAFTLVEMLIVIVIIGLLSRALIPRLTSARARANDTARKADLRQIATALTMYQMDKGNYPDGNAIAWDTNSTANKTLLQKYIPTMPRDPKNSSVTTYG